jgi:hypothetical protein
LLDDDVDLVIVNTPVERIMNMQNKSFLPENTLLSKSFDNGCSSAGIGSFCQEKFETVAVFQNRRWDNDFKTVQKIISEKIGDIVEAEFHFDR